MVPRSDLPQTDVVVLGAGMVGTCAALALKRQGKSVTLIDKASPGSGTSFGNAGVLSHGSMVPLNNPALLGKLPRLMLGLEKGLAYRPGYMVAKSLSLLKFLAHCRMRSTKLRAIALHQLIARSIDLFPGLLAEAGVAHRLSTPGWLRVYRTSRAPAADSIERRLLDAAGVRYDMLDGDGVRELEPALTRSFRAGLWLKDSMALDDPGATVAALAEQFVAMGGTLLPREAIGAEPVDGGWCLALSDGATITASDVLICLGPWSADWLARLGVRLPMIYEHGGHLEFSAAKRSLNRPIHDVDGGYVAAPLAGRVRLTSGVTLAPLQGGPSRHQVADAERKLREILPVGERLLPEYWSGTRPTLPDSLPAIGPTKRPGLWLACGHQHVGMATGPASGELAADLILRRSSQISPDPFHPARFGV